MMVAGVDFIPASQRSRLRHSRGLQRFIWKFLGFASIEKDVVLNIRFMRGNWIKLVKFIPRVPDP